MITRRGRKETGFFDLVFRLIDRILTYFRIRLSFVPEDPICGFTLFESFKQSKHETNE